MTTRSPTFAFLLIAGGTAIGIAGTDLMLPTIPELPRLLGGTAERAQLVLAAFTAGAAAGLLMFGELGARFDQRVVLVWSLLAYAAVSLLCGRAEGLDGLIALRFLQGAAGAAAAVFAPGMLRVLYGDGGAVKAIGLLGSIEALAPALAPIVGLWLLRGFGWRSSFDVIAGLAALIAAADIVWRRQLPEVVARQGVSGYWRLLHNETFVRLALSHAFTLGALLVIVFGAPAVFVASLGGTLSDFIRMQLLGVGSFMIVANLSGRWVARFGARRLIVGGTALAAAGAVAIFGYGLAGGTSITMVTGLFLIVNGGLAARGPAGFHAAIVAAQDDARGAALAVIAILLTAAIGTAAVAPFIGAGLVAIGAGGAVLAVLAVALVVTVPLSTHAD